MTEEDIASGLSDLISGLASCPARDVRVAELHRVINRVRLRTGRDELTSYDFGQLVGTAFVFGWVEAEPATDPEILRLSPGVEADAAVQQFRALCDKARAKIRN